jgi:hypothetical protein
VADALGVALKGGHNAEHHNHNDVGSYVVALAGGTPLLDPGAEVYTARTFSSRRYDSKVLNSFAHPVPLIGGKLQRAGRQAAGKILKAEFTEKEDILSLDLKSVYAVKELQHLVRTFTFSREGRGSLTVTDEVKLSKPTTFETALITLLKWEREGTDRLIVGTGSQAVEVRIDAGDLGLEIEGERVDENVRTRTKPTRIRLGVKKPLLQARVTITVRPR